MEHDMRFDSGVKKGKPATKMIEAALTGESGAKDWIYPTLFMNRQVLAMLFN